MVFDPLPGGGAPTLETVREGLAARLGQLPRYSQRLSSTRTGGFAWPHWVADERFEIANHVRHAALPPPGTDAQLCDCLAEMFSHPLDRSRPLWEIVLVEGLEGGRWAIAHKTHHCLVDGVGSVDVVQLLLDDEPEPAERSARRAAAGSEVSETSSNGRRDAACARCDRAGRRSRHARCERHGARRSAPERGAQALAGARRPDGARGDRRRAGHVAQRSDRPGPAVRGPPCAVGRTEGDRPRPPRLGQRRRARCLHHGPAAPARAPRRAPPRARAAGDGADEPEGRVGADGSGQPGDLAVRRVAGRAGRPGRAAAQDRVGHEAAEIQRRRRRARRL